jgi:hypothetical protein
LWLTQHVGRKRAVETELGLQAYSRRVIEVREFTRAACESASTIWAMHFPLLVALTLAATFEPENLKGAMSMRVVVENVPGGDKVGLDPNLVQADIEANLRKAGIKVTQIAGMLPYVYLQMNVLSLPDGCFVYSLHLSLKTGANSVTTKRLIMADLWSDGVLNARCSATKASKANKADNTEVLKVIQKSITDETNKMVADILSANQG